jgi:methyltransferase-like protein/trans-aconitate methyltransferase
VSGAASSYDQVPYTSLAFPQTHPDHLAAVAGIFGLVPPDVTRSRVLELGCASGGNLVPMAFNLPASEFIGIDHSPRQVADAQAAIAALGLRNVRIESASIEDIDRSWGSFDYIICHGVFSWVDAAVQDSILRIAGEQLTPQGIAYVSYNTYPGWHMREMARDMMRYHAAQFADAGEQVAQARALLTFLAGAAEPASAYGQWLASEAERAGRAEDSYVFHEHLERTNLPVYFHEFIARAAGAGLQFLSESAVTEMLTSHFPRPVAETLERISPDILHLEQYMDFVRNRQFRQTLLCRADAHPRRSLSPDLLRGRLVSSAATAGQVPIPLDPSTAVRFSNGRQSANVVNPAAKAAFGSLAEAWPRAVAVDDVCERAVSQAAAHQPDVPADRARASVLDDLLGAVMYGLVNLHTHPPPCTNSVMDRPRAHPVARWQAAGGTLVVNAHHQMVDLDPFAREVLVLADGGRTRADILSASAERASEGHVNAGDLSARAPVDNGLLSERVDAALAVLLQHGLLVG